MSVYLDASVLVSLFVDDANSVTAMRKVGRLSELVVVSDLAAAEFASAIARLVRVRDLAEAVASAAFRAVDSWVDENAEFVSLSSADVAAAGAMLRRLDSPLRTPDAMNLAIAQRLGAGLITFDQKMRDVAKKAGLRVV